MVCEIQEDKIQLLGTSLNESQSQSQLFAEVAKDFAHNCLLISSVSPLGFQHFSCCVPTEDFECSVFERFVEI